jgi:glycosyltransferase involved in cell wall biosynthesis
VSIVICTYNRAWLLRETLAALQTIDLPDECRTEIIVVDNNSTDDTAAIVAEAARDSRVPLVSLFEPRQGKSFALNTALSHAQGEILAHLDDDVLPSREWLARIVRSFRERDVTFVFGKVLPRWVCPPPPELLTPPAQEIWGPLGLVDYGDEPVEYRPESTAQRLPVGGNLAFSRAALVEIGGWRNDLGKVNNTLISGEDYEIFMRLRRFRLYAGYYDPAAAVRHFVPAERLTRRYFRRWFFWHGKTQALMLGAVYPELDMSSVPTIAGVPRFVYRQAVQQCIRYLRSRVSGPTLTARIAELHLIRYLGLLVGCYRQWRGLRLSSPRGLEPRIVK